MTRLIIILALLLADSVTGLSQGLRRGKEEQANVDNFLLTAIPTVHSSADSIRLLVYLRIPYQSIQFVKSGTVFQARYTASVSIQNGEGLQVGRESWLQSIQADDYLETTSQVVNSLHFGEFVVSPDDYKVIGEVFDEDTRQSGLQEVELGLQSYQGSLVLYPPILLDKYPGEWGFQPGEIPLFRHRIKQSTGPLPLLITAGVDTGTYRLQVRTRDRDRDEDQTLLWNWVEDFHSDQRMVTQRLEIPVKELEGLRVELEVVLHQGSRERHETIELSMHKPGISASITNLRLAIQQMRYILTDKEWKQFSTAKGSEKEDLFQSYWINRDPTPGTQQNEVMDEYFARIYFAGENFTSFQPGWKTDMGMIYVLFGPPDEIERSTRSPGRIVTQNWLYYRINRNFLFIDENGFGEYRLNTPYYLAPRW